MEMHKMTANGVNVLSLEKNGKFYAMTLAWATAIDYDRLIMCVGGQSDTGKALSKGDIVGFSALALDQKEMGDEIGSTHSSEANKKEMAPFEMYEGAYVIKGAVNEMVGKVVEIRHYPEAPEDNIVIVKIMNAKKNEKASFLVYA